MKTPAISVLCITLAASAHHAETPVPASPAPAPAAVADPVQHLDAPGAAKALAAADALKNPGKAVTIIDVRTPGEFAEGHLQGALNVDIASPGFAAALGKLDPAKTYLVHCAAGGRSTRSLTTLKKLGFKSILHLDGGINAWKQAGLPLEKPAAAKVD